MEFDHATHKFILFYEFYAFDFMNSKAHYSQYLTKTELQFLNQPVHIS